MKTCQDCGSPIPDTTNRLYCDFCAAERQKLSKREWRSRNLIKCREDFDAWYKEFRAVPPYVHIRCNRCNMLFVAASRRTKFCDYCKAAKNRENAQRWRQLNPDKVREQKRRQRESR